MIDLDVPGTKDHLDALGLLKEIEAWICFRLMGEEPNFPHGQMHIMRQDIMRCIEREEKS